MGTVAKGFNLPACLEAAAVIESDLTRLTSRLTEAQFHAPSRMGGWSIGYCIEHLVLTGRAFLPNWDRALREAARNGFHGAQNNRYAWWQRKILEVSQNPSVLKHKTAAPLVPCCRHSIDETVGRFLAWHQELVRRLASCRALDTSHTNVQSPFVPGLRYKLGFSFDLVLAHERRHLCQAWQVRRQLVDET